MTLLSGNHYICQLMDLWTSSTFSNTLIEQGDWKFDSPFTLLGGTFHRRGKVTSLVKTNVSLWIQNNSITTFAILRWADRYWCSPLESGALHAEQAVENQYTSLGRQHPAKTRSPLLQAALWLQSLHCRSQRIPWSSIHKCKKPINIIFLIRCLMSTHFNKFTVQPIGHFIKFLIQLIIVEALIFLWTIIILLKPITSSL